MGQLNRRDRLHGLKEPGRDPGGASVGVALPDDLDAGMPSIASIGTVTAGAPRIEVGLALGRGVGRLARARRVEDDPGFHVGLLLRRVHAPRREGTFTFCPAP